MSLQFIQELTSYLNQEDQVYDRLLQLLEEEKQHVIHNDRMALNQNIQLQEMCFTMIQQLEGARQELVKNFGQQKKMVPDQLTLARLIPMIMHAGLRLNLQELQKRLMTKIEKIKYLGQLNRILIQQAMTFIDYSIDLFREVVTSNRNQVYSPYGLGQNEVVDGHAMLNYNA